MTKFTQLDRRSLLRGAILMVGATVSAGGSQLLAGEGNDPAFALNDKQRDALTAYADTLLPKTETPGALDVGVPQALEGLLREWSSAKERNAILEALAALDEASQAATGQLFATLDPVQRAAVLKPIDAAALKVVPSPAGEKTTAFARPPLADPAYANLRRVVMALYFYAEPIQLDVLGYEHDPGVWEPTVPVTEDTRPGGGSAYV